MNKVYDLNNKSFIFHLIIVVNQFVLKLKQQLITVIGYTLHLSTVLCCYSRHFGAMQEEFVSVNHNMLVRQNMNGFVIC